MTNNRDILAITDAIQYFQSQITAQTHPRQLQNHLLGLEAALDKPSLANQMPSSFLLSLLTLVAQRYYELSTLKDHQLTQEYLLVKIVQFIELLYERTRAKSPALKKDLMVIMMSATVTQAKNAFEANAAINTDLRTCLLDFNYKLLVEIVRRQDFKIEQIYPKQYSLCSSILKTANISLKNFGLCLQTMTTLIWHNGQLKMRETSRFSQQCLKRLLVDVNYLANEFYKYEMAYRKKVEGLSLELLNLLEKQEHKTGLDFHGLTQTKNTEKIKQELFSSSILLAQLSCIPIQSRNFNLYQRTLIEDSYRNLYLVSTKLLLKAEVDIELKKRQINKITYLNQFIAMDAEDDEALTAAIELLSKVFSVGVKHNLITIPHHATTIPLNPLQPTHTLQNYPFSGLKDEFRKEKSRILVELMPFFELQPNLVDLMVHYFANLSMRTKHSLLEHFSNQLLKYEYSLNMPLVKLYSHMKILCIVNFILCSTSELLPVNTLNTLLQCLGNKSEVVKTLRASYVEEELLIALTIQIIDRCCFFLRTSYQAQGDARAKIKISQIQVVFIQKLLNELSQSSYLIRLVCTTALLDLAQQDRLQSVLRPYQTTILLRNKNNLELILNLLEITTMNQVDYEQLAEFYLKHHGAQPILRYLLPKVSIQMGRKCLLTVERWWLLLNQQVISWLHCKEMKKPEDPTEIFATNDGQNVSIKNALGVIVIEIGQKWTFYLRSQKRETIVDILINLAVVSPALVFFKSGFTKILRQLYRILLECLGRQELPTTTSKTSKSTIKIKTSLEQISKVEFYSRLRQKIYKLLTLLPSQNLQLYDSDIVKSIRQLHSYDFEAVKRQYLFEGNSQLKSEYDLLKKVNSLFECQ